jgi:protein SCO1/2
MNLRSLAQLLLFPLLLSSCAKQEQKETNLLTFPLKGEVVAIDTISSRITISHEEIQNYMMAMTMPFKVKNRALFGGVSVGDSVICTLVVSRTESWLETIQVSTTAEKPQILAPGDIQLRHLYQPGDTLPNEPLTNQDGRVIRISNFRGQAMALTFIYTRCPLPDFCIRMSNNFARIQRALSKDRSLDGRWHLLSISFDPKYDTPSVLKSYAKTYGADFTSWDFVTGSPTSIARLAGGLDLAFAEDEGLIQHNLRTALLNKEGKLVRVVNGNEWNVDEITEAIVDLSRR